MRKQGGVCPESVSPALTLGFRLAATLVTVLITSQCKPLSVSCSVPIHFPVLYLDIYFYGLVTRQNTAFVFSTQICAILCEIAKKQENKLLFCSYKKSSSFWCFIFQTKSVKFGGFWSTCKESSLVNHFAGSPLTEVSGHLTSPRK